MVLPTELPDSLRGRPFTVTQARVAGVNENVLRGARFRRLFRDVYADAALPVDTRLRACGLQLVLPRRSAFCLHTAAELYGLPVKDDVLHVCVADPGSRPRHREGLRIHEVVSREDIRVHNGLLLTTPERTYLDLASVLDLIRLVVVGDAMLRSGVRGRSPPDRPPA